VKFVGTLSEIRDGGAPSLPWPLARLAFQEGRALGTSKANALVGPPAPYFPGGSTERKAARRLSIVNGFDTMLSTPVGFSPSLFITSP